MVQKLISIEILTSQLLISRWLVWNSICPTPPALRLDSWLKSDMDKHRVFPIVEYFSTL